MNNMEDLDFMLEEDYDFDSWWQEQAEKEWEEFCHEVGLEELLDE